MNFRDQNKNENDFQPHMDSNKNFDYFWEMVNRVIRDYDLTSLDFEAYPFTTEDVITPEGKRENVKKYGPPMQVAFYWKRCNRNEATKFSVHIDHYEFRKKVCNCLNALKRMGIIFKKIPDVYQAKFDELTTRFQ